MNELIIPMARAGLADKWKQFWGTIKAPLGGIVDLLGIVGIVLIIMSGIGLLWQRRRGGGGSNGVSGFLITLIIGAVLALPDLIGVVVPIFDLIVDAIFAVVGIGG